MMQTLSKRDKGMLVVLAIFVIGVFLWLRTTPSGGSAVNRSMLSLEDATKSNVKTQLEYRRLKEELDTMEPRNRAQTYNLPPEQLSAYITQDLYALADRAGAHIREIKPLKARVLASGSLMRVPLEVRFRAPFQPNVMRFLYYAEAPDKKIVVDKVNITSTDTHLKAVDVAAQITVYTRVVTNTSSGAGEGDASESTDTNSRR